MSGMFDFIMGLRKGIGEVEITSDMVFSDDGEGNVTVTTSEEDEDDG